MKFMERKFVRDTVALQTTSLVQSFSYLLTSILTARFLGPHELGRWVAGREIYTLIFLLLSLGLSTAAISLYSTAMGKGDRAEARDVLASLLKIGGVVVLAVIALGYGLGPWAGEQFFGDRGVGLFVRIICFASVGEIMRAVAMAALNGTRQMKRYALFDMTANVLRVGFVATALILGTGAEPVAFAFVAHALATSVLAFLAYQGARREGGEMAPPHLGEVVAAIPAAPIRAFLGRGSLLALNKLFDALGNRIGIILIPALGVAMASETRWEDNAAYSIATVLTLVMAGLVGAIARAVLPTLGLQSGESEVHIENMGPLIRRVTLIAGGLSFLAILATIPVMWGIVHWGYGAEYGEAFTYYLWIVLGQLSMGFMVAVDAFYIYSGRLRQYVFINMVLITVALAVIVTAGTVFGPMGIAVGTGISVNLRFVHLVYIWRYFKRVNLSTLKGPGSSKAGVGP